MPDKGYILIVEDSQTQARQLETIIKPLGYQIDIAYNGKEALSMVKAQKPAIVICDILMPEMDGYEVCRQMKSDEKLRDIPVVLLTQLSDPKEIVKGLECGADDFIVKPYNEDLLLARISAIFALKLRKDQEHRQVRILVVEDSPTQAEQLSFLLESQGYTVSRAANGKEALICARQSRPTLIVSDILMPVMDGYELAYEIKHDEALKDIPIILVTSLMDRKEILRRASVVADGFFTKPYEDRYLLDKIASLLSPHRDGDDGDKKGLEVTFGGDRFLINSGRRQILTFLLSTYENAVQQNRDLILMQRELQALNEQLEERVVERTEQLQASEAKYRMLLETNADAIIVVGRGNGVYFANKAAQDLLGLKAEELVGRKLEFPVSPGEKRDIEITRPDGGAATAEMRVAATTWGEEKACLATLRDITDRKNIEMALRESEENFRALAENANDGILIETGTDGRIVYANRRISDMTGYGVDEILRMSLAVLTPDALTERQRRQALEGPQRTSHYETALVRKNGPGLPVEKAASRTFWHGRPASILIIRDIAERKKREEEIIMASKLESLGTLAGGIAHDFNNLLTGVVGNVSLAKVLVNPEDKIYNMLANLEKASLRAKDLTQQLLTFAKGGAPVKKTVHIDSLIRDSADFMLTGSNIKCEYSMAEALWPLDVDEGQMSQVIHNLIINAEQAMPRGGVINVSVENVEVSEGDKPAVREGRYVRIIIRDTGVGIPEKNLARIFDPYFTTKKDGTGLGLATVYSIIKNHGGCITAESTPGAGTAFHIYLPAAEKGISQAQGVEEKAFFGKGAILVMDDEEIVRDVAESILTELGYEVEFARDGAEAIEAYTKRKKEGRPYSAVIMDLTIPGGMGGKDAIKKLIEIDPAVKAIVSSGYSDDSIMSDYKKFGFSAVIAKPYRITDLSKTVYRVVTGKSD